MDELGSRNFLQPEATLEELEAGARRRINDLCANQAAPAEDDLLAHMFVRLLVASRNELWTPWVKLESLSFMKCVEHCKDPTLLQRWVESVPEAQLLAATKNEQLAQVKASDIVAAYLAKDTTVMLQTPFENVPHMVADRQCVVRNGMAWTEIIRLPWVLKCIFQRRLHASHAAYRRLASQAALDTRIIELFDSLGAHFQQRLSSLDNGGTGGGDDDWLRAASRSAALIDLEELDRIWAMKMPLCSRAAHERLLVSHHLKHFDRLQHTLFLKGIGLSVKQTTQLFVDHFLQIMTAQDFHRKRYEYSIRHIYGLEGARFSRLPFGCQELITEDSAANNCNGCAFRNSSGDRLYEIMKARGLENEAIATVLAAANAKEYNKACHLELRAMLRKDGVGGATAENAVMDSPHVYFNIRRILSFSNAPSGSVSLSFEDSGS